MLYCRDNFLVGSNFNGKGPPISLSAHASRCHEFLARPAILLCIRSSWCARICAVFGFVRDLIGMSTG